MNEATEVYSIEIRAMSDGRLLVSMPTDQVIALRLMDAAREIMQQQYAKQGSVQIASPYDVLPKLLEGVKS